MNDQNQPQQYASFEVAAPTIRTASQRQGETTAPTENTTAQPLNTQEIQAENQQIPSEQISIDESIERLDATAMAMKPEEKEVQEQQEVEAKDAAYFRRLLKEASEEVESSGTTTNMDKMPLAVPLSNFQKLAKLENQIVSKNPTKIREMISDMTSPLQAVGNSRTYMTSNIELLTDGLKHVTKKTDETEEHLERLNALKRSYQGIGDSHATPLALYKDKNEVVLTGTDATMVMSSLTDGMRQLTLWHSGFQITLRSLPLNFLNQFYREINHEDFEYGREFGMFYYLYSDLAITKYVIEKLLPFAICGSTYAHWNDRQKLLEAISFQDFHVILWALGAMMHPKGVHVSYVCAEEGCGHVHNEFADLSKLRLVNTTMITDAMVRHFQMHQQVSDKHLEEYRAGTQLNNWSIKFETGEGPDLKKWDISTRQPSLADYVTAGNAYLAEIRTNSNLADESAVQYYSLYNGNKVYKPWIDSISLTVPTPEGHEKKFVVENNSENDAAINTALDVFQKEGADFATKMRNYILDTKLVHICFHFPQCPECGKEPENGYHGYIPYDPMRAFFTLALMKLLQGASTNPANDK